MSFPEPEPGLVIRLSYLWRRDHDEGRDEGVKDRPCVIISRSREGRVFVLPITHSSPKTERLAMELPPRVKAHLGLDEARSWVVLDECNSFDWPGYDLRANAKGRFDYGRLPPRLFERIRDALMVHIRAKGLQIISRD